MEGRLADIGPVSLDLADDYRACWADPFGSRMSSGRQARVRARPCPRMRNPYSGRFEINHDTSIEEVPSA